MDIIFVLSFSVTLFSLALVLVGIPAQIRKNYYEKRSGQPLTTILIALAFYLSQIGLFFVMENYLPLFSFLVGFMMWFVILIQYIIYEKK